MKIIYVNETSNEQIKEERRKKKSTKIVVCLCVFHFISFCLQRERKKEEVEESEF